MLFSHIYQSEKYKKPPPLIFSWEIYEFFKTAETATSGIP